METRHAMLTTHFFGLLMQLHYHFIQDLHNRLARSRRMLWATLRRRMKRRRNFLLQELLATTGNAVTCVPMRSRKATIRRNTDWWDITVANHFTEQEWLENFRLTRNTFDYICNELREELKPSIHSIMEPLSVEKKVAIALYKLASFSDYTMVANQFGVHKTSVKKCLYMFCQAVNKVLLPRYIKLPDAKEAKEIAFEYQREFGIPLIMGAIGVTHIPILQPSCGEHDFVNVNGWKSYILQALVDDQDRFRNITVKHPGSYNNAAVLRDSKLYRIAQERLSQKTMGNGSQEAVLFGDLVIIGDATYPSFPWLVKGFPDVTTPQQLVFNMRLDRVRKRKDAAFGRLKARWRCILKRLDIHYKFVPVVVATCCVLHNLVESCGEEFLESWYEQAQEAEVLYPQPEGQT